MRVTPIPDWGPEGFLPPIDLASPTSSDRSPYLVSLTDFVLRFNTSAERGTILAGLLDYRSRFHAIGLTQGFQWVDGSFLENAEVTLGRSPADVDVVTFYKLPSGQTQLSLLNAAPWLGDASGLKKEHKVDGYVVELGGAPARLVRTSAYWYSVWSHRRDYRWKGFVQFDLDPGDDAAARAMLHSPAHNGGGP